MEPANVRTRYASRVTELSAMGKADRQGGDSNGVAAQMLAAAGDLLRRQVALEVEVSGVEAALSFLPKLDGPAFLRSLGLEEISSRISRAADEAVEATLPEGAEEAETWSIWALEGLSHRDRLQSIHAALLALGASDVAEPLAARLHEEDRRLKGKARWFTGLNAVRRAERDLLDANQRESAWWFSSRADCDGLIACLGGDRQASERHLTTCGLCRKDLAVAEEVQRPRTRHLTQEDLWKLDLGILSRGERAAVDHHAARCMECRRALMALADGERAIAEATSAPLDVTAFSAQGGGDRASVPRGPPGERTLAESAEFRVVLFRRGDTRRLVVQPRAGAHPQRRMAEAAVLMPDLQRPPLRPRRTPLGFEFELPGESSLPGSRITLQIQWDDGGAPDEQKLLL